MFKRTAIISVVFIFMFAASFCVADEHREGADARRIEERITHLHEMIEQGEVKLDRMRAESKELEAMLRRESGDRDEGRRGEERQLAEAKERIVHLREAAAEAKERGDIEKAKRLWEESKEIEHALAREMQGRDFRRHAGEVERKFHAMMGEAEKLERAGKRDEAHEIRRHAEKMVKGLRRHHEEMREKRLVEAKQQVVHLRELSEEAEQRGEIEKAKHLWRQSKEIEGAIEREIEGRHDEDDDDEDRDEEDDDDEGDHDEDCDDDEDEDCDKEDDDGDDDDEDCDDEEDDDDEDDLEEDVDELADEVKALRREVAELREIIEKLRRR